MSEKNKLQVKDFEIGLDETFVNLTDIAKSNSDRRPSETLRSWIRNAGTLNFLEEWEQQNNPRFKGVQMDAFKKRAGDNRRNISIKQYAEETNAIGLYNKPGRGGGTYAHIEIAIAFCYWLSPPFAVWMIRAFKTLAQNEIDRKSLEYHITRITDSIDEARNWLDTVPGQRKERNRLESPPQESERSLNKTDRGDEGEVGSDSGRQSN